jgi:hypothetical protein
MTKYFAVLLAMAVLSTPVLGAEVQFVPLRDYIGQPGVTQDPVALAYVMERCSALYGVFAKNLEGELDPQRQKFKAEALDAGEEFMGAAAQLMMRGTTIEIKDALARTSKTVTELGNLYVDRIEAVRLRTNNMFTDNLVAGDFATCKDLRGKM